MKREREKEYVTEEIFEPMEEETDPSVQEEEQSVPFWKQTKKKVFWKQIGLSAMVACLALALYLNWQSVSVGMTEESGSSDAKYYGEAELVGASLSVKEENAVLAAAKTERKQQIDAEKSELSSTCRDEKLPESVRSEAVTKLQQLAENMRLCGEMETRIKAKGLSDCMVYYDGKRANVLVVCKSGELDADMVTAIRDVVVGETSLPVSAITIAEVSLEGEEKSDEQKENGSEESSD